MPIPGTTRDDENYMDRLERIRNASRNPVDIAQARNVRDLARAYPGISPGIAYALTKQGIGPGQQAQQIWQRELATRMNREPGTTARKKRGKKREITFAQAFDYATRQTNDEPSDGGWFGTGIDPIYTIEQGLKGDIPAAFQGPEHAVLTEKQGSGLPLPGDNEVGDLAKPVIRTATTVAMAGLEGLIGAARVGPGNPQTQPSLSNPFGQIEAVAEQTTLLHQIEGESTGDGYIPSWDSPAMKAQAESARKYSPYLIGGHAWTPGRQVADYLYEPDDIEFDLISGGVDASIALSKLDPAGFGLAKLGAARAATKRWATPIEVMEQEARAANVKDAGFFWRKTLAEGGAVDGIRKGFSPRNYARERTTPRMQEFFRRLAEEDSALNIHHATGLPVSFSTGPHGLTQIPILKALKEETDPEKIANIYGHLTGTYIRDIPQMDILGRLKWDTAGRSRLLSSVPKSVIAQDSDLNEIAYQGDLHLINARASYQDREKFFDQVVDASTRPKQVAALELHADIMRPYLTNTKLSEPQINELLTYFKNKANQQAIYLYDNFGDPITTPGMVVVGGEDRAVPHIMLPSQLLSSAIDMPNPREVRKAVSEFEAFYSNPAISLGTDLLDTMQVPWRKLMLMRAAWGVRVVGEEQIRLATQFNSIFHHPIRALAWVVGNPDSRFVDKMHEWETKGGMPGAIARYTEEEILKLKGRYGRGQFDNMGDTFLNDYAYRGSNYRRFDEIRGHRDKIYTGEFTMVDTRGEKGAEALADEIARMHEDGLVRGLLKHDDIGSAKAWFWGDAEDDTGIALRKYLADDPALHRLRDSREVADSHVEAVLEGLGTVSFGGNARLVEAMKTGHIDGIRIMKKGRLNDAAVSRMQQIIDEAPAASIPARIKMSNYKVLNADEQRRASHRLGEAFDYMFEALMPRPSNYLSRSPAFRQYYWERQAELFSDVGPVDRAKILDNARAANVDGAIINRLKSVDIRMKDRAYELGADYQPRLNIRTSDAISKQYGLKKTKELLYDLSERGQVFDVLRFMFPFGEAWREVVTTWGRLLTENPQVFRRGTQLLMGARSPESSAINRAQGIPIDQPFFYKGQFGDEQVAFPLTKYPPSLFGVPIPLKGSVQGLNLIGNGLPGFGFAAQIPLSYLLANRPKGDFLRETVMPYGAPSTNPLEAVAEAYAPGWLKQARIVLDDPKSSRDYASTMKGVIQWKITNEPWRLQGPDAAEQMAEILDESARDARLFQIYRTIGAFTLPSAPSPEWFAADKSGRLLMAWKISEEYSKMIKRHDGDTDAAFTEFLNTFGTKNIFTIQAKNRRNLPAADRLLSTAGSKWVKNHEHLAAQLPNTYPLFAPDSKDFDGEALKDSIARHEFTPLTPREMLEASNSRLANFTYYNKVDERRTIRETIKNPTLRRRAEAEDSRYQQQLKRELYTEMPGYDPDKRSTPGRDAMMAELYQAVDIPEVMRTPAGRALRKWIALREDTLAQQRAAGLTGNAISTSKRVDRQRAWLNEQGQKLVEKHPSFQPMWDLVWSREVS